MQNVQVYSAFAAPHWAVGLRGLFGAMRVANFATFFTSVLCLLWQVGRGSRKARWCSTSPRTPLWLATQLRGWLVSFNLLGAHK